MPPVDPRDVDLALQKRYGQARFNPAAGQTQMTFQEWLDRHPALQGRGGPQNFDAYHGAIHNAYSGPQDVAAPKQVAGPAGAGTSTVEPMPTNTSGASEVLPEGPTTIGPEGGNATSEQRDAVARIRPDMPVGGRYKDFVKSHGGKSTAGLAATWRNAQGLGLTNKMAASAAGRRIKAKKAKQKTRDA